MSDNIRIMGPQNGHNSSHRRASLFAVLAVVLLAAQSLIVFHAAKYGDEPHDHHGQPCVVSVVSHDGDKGIAAAAMLVAAVIITWRVAGVAAQTERARIAVRAARPRGPPLQ